METIDVGKEFNSRLTDRSQATIFIDKYLIKLLDKSIWANDDPFILSIFMILGIGLLILQCFNKHLPI